MKDGVEFEEPVRSVWRGALSVARWLLETEFRLTWGI